MVGQFYFGELSPKWINIQPALTEGGISILRAREMMVNSGGSRPSMIASMISGERKPPQYRQTNFQRVVSPYGAWRSSSQPGIRISRRGDHLFGFELCHRRD
jgi:hypothetical protein